MFTKKWGNYLIFFGVIFSTLASVECQPRHDLNLPKATKPSDYKVIRNVQLITMLDSVIQKNMSVVLLNDKINWVGKTSKLAAYPGGVMIEGNNNFLLPGLSDMHVHIRSEIELLSYLYYGVTTVLQLSGPNGGIDLFKLKEAIRSGETKGPTIYMTGPMLDGDPSIWSEPVSLAIKDAQMAKEIVEKQAEEGYDFIKIYNRLSKDAFNAVMQTSNEKGMAVVGHIPRKPGALYALSRGMDMIAHMEEFFFSYFDCVECGKEKGPDQGKIPALVQKIKESGAWVTPNLSFVAATRFQLDDLAKVIADPEFQFLTSRQRRGWMRNNPTTRSNLEFFDAREVVKFEFCRVLTREFHRAGIPLLAGTDASVSGVYPGKSMYLELSEMTKSGLSNYEALKTATTNAGRFIELHSKNKGLEFGKIAIGKRADLLLVSINPLEEINFAHGIQKIIYGGVLMEREAINRMRTDLIEE